MTDYLDHWLRRYLLANPGNIVLATGTEDPIFPLINTYNGRQGIPLRTTSTSIIIDIDLGGIYYIEEVRMLGTNADTLVGDSVILRAGTLPPPGPWSFNITWSPSYPYQDDWIASNMLRDAVFILNQNVRYLRLDLSQTNRRTSNTIIGEIWVERLGSPGWYNNMALVESTLTQFSWPATQMPVIFEDMNSKRLRSIRLQTSIESRSDVSGIAALLEVVTRAYPLAPAIEEQFNLLTTYELSGQITSFSFSELRLNEHFRARSTTISQFQTNQNSGDIA